MNRRFAADTSVPIDRSKAEIEKTLARYGATGFLYGWSKQSAQLGFEMLNRRILFRMPMPLIDDFARTPKGQKRSPADAQRAWEQAQRQKWRALHLVIKAKLEAVESGITEFEEEFLAHIVLPSGQTYGEWAIPQIATAYEQRQMPPLLTDSKKERKS